MSTLWNTRSAVCTHCPRGAKASSAADVKPTASTPGSAFLMASSAGEGALLLVGVLGGVGASSATGSGLGLRLGSRSAGSKLLPRLPARLAPGEPSLIPFPDPRETRKSSMAPSVSPAAVTWACMQ